MDKCSFEDVMSSIPTFRETYQSNNTVGIVKDIIAICYDSKSSEYTISYNMITAQGKVIAMDWAIDLPFTIPEVLRKEAKDNTGRPIGFHETAW